MNWKEILKEQRTLMDYGMNKPKGSMTRVSAISDMKSKIPEIKMKLQGMVGRIKENTGGEVIDYATNKLKQLAEIEASQNLEAFEEFYDKNLKYNLGEK